MKKMFRVTALLLCALLSFALTACGSQPSASSSADSQQIPNPWVDCKTLEEAEKLAGFDFPLPAAPEGYDDASFSAIEGQIIQVVYRKGEQELCLRKAAGTEDCSGDYNRYTSQQVKDVRGISVTFKGDDNGFHLALWADAEQAYSVFSSDALSEEALTALVEGIVSENASNGGEAASVG